MEKTFASFRRTLSPFLLCIMTTYITLYIGTVFFNHMSSDIYTW